MAGLEDLAKASPLQLLSVGVIGVALPLFVPALRPQFAAVLKAGAKLFIEAEFDADDALADRLVDATVGHLLALASRGSEEERTRNADKAVSHFVAAARKTAHRRGFDAQDASRRYHRRLAKLDHALSRAKRNARHGQRPVLEHASRLIEERAASPGHAVATPVPRSLPATQRPGTEAVTAPKRPDTAAPGKAAPGKAAPGKAAPHTRKT